MALFNGFGFSGYRSFGGEEIIRISPLKKINFIIGKNNSGKSNVVNFLSGHLSNTLRLISARNTGQLSAFKDKYKLGFDSFDHPFLQKTSTLIVSFPILKSNLLDEIEKRNKSRANKTHIKNHLDKLFNSGCFFTTDNYVWFDFCFNEIEKKFELDINLSKLKEELPAFSWNELGSAFLGTSGGNIDRIADHVLEKLIILPKAIPSVEVIPAIRKIGTSGTTSSDFSGEGIIDRLAKIQNPAITEQKEREKFNAVNHFLQKVLENNTAVIDIPHDRSMIIVHMDGKTLPLEQLGTGIHEVIILAVASTLLENTIVCIEEPELHLHPTLQRKLIHYLNENTSNQYILTTHSAHLLDAVDAQVFHVTQQDGMSRVESISSDQQKSSICHDLGYKASDILQANCIIWVEGPSDRVYINYWLKAYIKESNLPELIEGVHYSIMFYGGRLFSHLTALDNNEAEEFIEDMISVRKLNRNAVIVFDSDKDGPRKKLNSTKQRLQNEFDNGVGFAWVTKGREVENYLDMDLLEETVKCVHPSASHLVSKTEWSNLLEYQPKKKIGTTTTAKKVNVARKYIEDYKADLSVLDLKPRVKQLVDFITKVNDI